ncbi:hypothetical protein GJ688_07305 [Heliobacillus mobilis]|uniref:Uncharacterized protein n=1 Tax=Heliobacterium mobile TaxID=28064 RepID=A0A6I3SJL4_HELMO|nr:hypothetical protein [Heliobacterium mobile]MTV48787.1 hypothetical protein [Heliobacterium mobile]
MKSLLMEFSGIINTIHDAILKFHGVGKHLSDTELHFWIIGFAGICIFLVVNSLFKYLAQWGLATVSFFFTTFFVIVMAVAIEVEQKITGRGNMETTDVIAGIAGYLVLFAVYMALVVVFRTIIGLIRKRDKREKDRNNDKEKYV